MEPGWVVMDFGWDGTLDGIISSFWDIVGTEYGEMGCRWFLDGWYLPCGNFANGWWMGGRRAVNGLYTWATLGSVRRRMGHANGVRWASMGGKWVM